MVGDNRKSISLCAPGRGGGGSEGEEAKGEDLDPVKHI